MLGNEEYQFCSREEVIERQKNGDVHLLEATIATADPKLPLSSRIMDKARAVKKFTRSGSSDLHKTYGRRGQKQLTATSRYLIYDIWWSTFTSPCHEGVFSKRNACDIDISTKYTFVMDRLQSVRQDITSSSMFNSDPVAIADLLKLLIYFYVHSMHIITALYCISADGIILAVDEGQAPYKKQSAHPVTTWFDLHSHESALSSCLTTALGSCRQLPLTLQLSVRNTQDEFSAYSTLLLATRQLRNAFEGIFNANSSSGHFAISQHSAVHSLMKCLLSKFAVLGSDSLCSLRELYSMESAIEIFESTEMHVAKGRKEIPSLALSKIALKCLSNIRQCNPAGAVRAFTAAARANSRHYGADSEGISLDSSISKNQRTILAALLHQLLPELRLLRFLQCNVAANKDDMLALVSTELFCSDFLHCLCSFRNTHLISFFVTQSSLSIRLWLPSLSNTPRASSQWGVTSRVIHEAALLLNIRVTGAGNPGGADNCAADSQLNCVILKASTSTANAGPSTAVSVDRNQRKDSDPDSQLKVRAALMGFISCHSREIPRGVAVVASSSSASHSFASNSSSPDVSCESKNTSRISSVKRPLNVVEIISALRDLLQEAEEEDWFGPSQPSDAHS
jgi:SAC3/GANP family